MTFAKRAYTAVERNPMQAIGWVLAFALIIILGLRGENTREQVTKVVNSPCYKDVGGKPCQKTKQLSDEERSVSSTCVLFYKVDKGGKLLKLTKCEVKGRPPGTKGSIEPVEPAGGATATGSAPSSSGNPANSTPPKSGSVGDPAPGKGGSGRSAEPPPSGSQPPAAPVASEPTTTSGLGNSEGSGSSESSKANPVAEGVGGTVEGVGDVVKDTGETVNGAVEGVTGKACGLVGASC